MERRIADFLIAQAIIHEKDKELYIYGLNKLKGIVINISMTILMGVLLDMVIESILFLIVYIPLRRYVGGYHAPSPVSCFILSTVLVAAVLLGIKYVPVNFYVVVTMLILSGLIIFVKAPVESKNRALSSNEKRVFRKRARLTLSVYSAIALFGYMQFPYFTKCVIFIIASIAIFTMFSDKINRHKTV